MSSSTDQQPAQSRPRRRSIEAFEASADQQFIRKVKRNDTLNQRDIDAISSGQKKKKKSRRSSGDLVATVEEGAAAAGDGSEAVMAVSAPRDKLAVVDESKSKLAPAKGSQFARLGDQQYAKKIKAGDTLKLMKKRPSIPFTMGSGGIGAVTEEGEEEEEEVAK